MVENNEVGPHLPTIHFAMQEDATLLIKDAEILSRANIDPNTNLKVLSLTNHQGALINNNNATWSFTPSKYFNGTVTLDCLITDGTHNILQQVNIDVQHIEHLFKEPEIELIQQDDGTYLIVTAQLLQSATDIEGDFLDIIEMTAPQGQFFNNQDGTWTFSPNSEFLGAIDLHFIVTDGHAKVSQNLLVTITPATFMPEIDYFMDENATLILSPEDLLQTVSDIDGDSLAITDMQQPQTGQLINNDNGTWTYISPQNYVGPLQLQFGIGDQRGAIIDQAINIYALSENAAAMQPKFLRMQTNGTVIITRDVLLDEDMFDNENTSIFNLASKQGAIKQFGGKNRRRWLFTPNQSFHGTIDLQYTISDGSHRSSRTIKIEIINNLQ